MIALPQLVQAQTQHAGDQFQQRVAAPVVPGARVGGNRLGRRFQQSPVGVHLVAQRLREAFPVGIARLAVDDQAQHPVGAAQGLVVTDLLVDPVRGRGIRRADHDQRRRIGQRALDLAAEFRRAGQLLAVAEHWVQPPRNRPQRRIPTDQPRWHPPGLQRAVQPRRPRLVGVAVADEGPVSPLLRHRDPLASCHPLPSGPKGYIRPSAGTQLKRPAPSRPCRASSCTDVIERTHVWKECPRRDRRDGTLVTLDEWNIEWSRMPQTCAAPRLPMRCGRFAGRGNLAG